MKSFITVDTLNWPTLENKLVQILPGGMLFLKKTVCIKAQAEYVVVYTMMVASQLCKSHTFQRILWKTK